MPGRTGERVVYPLLTRGVAAGDDDERGGRGGRADGGTSRLSVMGHGLTKDVARADASGAMSAPAM